MKIIKRTNTGSLKPFIKEFIENFHKPKIKCRTIWKVHKINKNIDFVFSN